MAFFFFVASVPAIKAQNEIAERSFFSFPLSNGYSAVIESTNFGLVDEDVAKETMNALERELFNGKGFKRNDDRDWYDEQEWVFIDLMVAEPT